MIQPANNCFLRLIFVIKFEMHNVSHLLHYLLADAYEKSHRETRMQSFNIVTGSPDPVKVHICRNSL